MLIALRRVIGLQAGKVIAERIIQVIQKYSFEKRLGYFVLDNAISNNTCIEATLQEL